jgi:bisanhydrobacterioruberin hydratase
MGWKFLFTQWLRHHALQIAIFLAVLFHVSGALGILYSDKANWFIQNTPLNLGLMAVVLWCMQTSKQRSAYLFLLLAFVTGMLVEIIGVNTGYLFGIYTYGQVLGPKILGVPLLIGINWWVTVVICGLVTKQLYHWVQQKRGESNAPLQGWQRWALIFDGAFLATLFDALMEPVAQQLGFWQWQQGIIPWYNYFCWFVVSAFLLYFYHRWQHAQSNYFAFHLLIVQSLFFLTLRLFYP